MLYSGIVVEPASIGPPARATFGAAVAMPSEVVTAAVLVIGDEILSGRTKDKNIGYIADYLTAIGIDLKEVRVVSDEEPAIVEALNALRARYTYVFTTGGIGPTHDDITAECVAKAFGVPIDIHPEALAILKERMAKVGGELNEARLRMARIPHGAELVRNRVSGAPGFRIGNVVTMAGIPTVMQAMLDEVASTLKTGAKLLSETIRADLKEGDVGTELGAIAKANPDAIIGSYPFFDDKLGPNTNIVVRSRDAQKLEQVKGAVEAMIARVKSQLAAG
jgi:molybdenum cofactor synthesis domain-containing protein